MPFCNLMKMPIIAFVLSVYSLLTPLAAQENGRKEFKSFDEMFSRTREFGQQFSSDLNVSMKVASKGKTPQEKLLILTKEWKKTESGKENPLPVGIAKVEDGDIAPKRPPISIHDDPVFLKNSAKVIDAGVAGRAFGPNATDARGREFRECVALGRSGSYRASGVIIQNDLILTAAHICPDDPELVPDLVWIGTVTTNSIDAPSKGKPLRISRYYRHADYNHGSTYEYPICNDLMLLEIHPEDRGEVIYKAELPTAEEIVAFETNPPSTVRAVGFGNNRLNFQSIPVGFGVRRYVSIGLAERNAERYGLCQSDINGKLVTMEFAAASKNAMADTCTGDSGGPVYIVTGPPSNSKFKLIGVTSRPTPGSQVVCGDGGVYAYFPAYQEWISIAYAPANRETWKKVE